METCTVDDLDERVAVVTGGARGIEQGRAECLSEAGAAVVIADIDLEAARVSSENLACEALALEHDVRSAISAEALAKGAKERFGRVDILVNIAGVGPKPGPIQDTNEEEYDRVMDTNAKGLSSPRARSSAA